MKTVMTFGTFDLAHPGHIFYLNEAKKLGDKLITVIARDANLKKRFCIQKLNAYNKFKN